MTDPDTSPGPEPVPFGHDPRMFPGELEFAGNRYSARKAAGQGFIVWDAGTFELAGDRLTMTLANDASTEYSVHIDRDGLTITGETGISVRYQRVH